MVNKFTDTMAALISNAFSLSFILFDRLVAYFLEWRVVTDQDAVLILLKPGTASWKEDDHNKGDPTYEYFLLI